MAGECESVVVLEEPPSAARRREGPTIAIPPTKHKTQDNFRLSGFPGIDKEMEDLSAFMQPVNPANSTILDLSCGSGLMARRLVRSGGWRRVIAADYSGNL